MRLKSIAIAILLVTNSVFAADKAAPAISGKPYANPTNLDTSLPDLCDSSQTVLTP
jgi:hypothetical protein